MTKKKKKKTGRPKGSKDKAKTPPPPAVTKTIKPFDRQVICNGCTKTRYMSDMVPIRSNEAAAVYICEICEARADRKVCVTCKAEFPYVNYSPDGRSAPRVCYPCWLRSTK